MLLRRCSAPGLCAAVAAVSVASRWTALSPTVRVARHWQSSSGSNHQHHNSNNKEDVNDKATGCTTTTTAASPHVPCAGAFAQYKVNTPLQHGDGNTDSDVRTQAQAPQPPHDQEQQQPLLSQEDVELIVKALRNEPEGEKQSVMGGPGIGTRSGDMLAAFTCGRCEHRTVKRFSKHAYTRGIVIVECPSCHVKHLLADHLGWLESRSWTVEDALRERQERFVHIGGGDYVVQPSAAEEEEQLQQQQQQQQQQPQQQPSDTLTTAATDDDKKQPPLS